MLQIHLSYEYAILNMQAGRRDTHPPSRGHAWPLGAGDIGWPRYLVQFCLILMKLKINDAIAILKQTINNFSKILNGSVVMDGRG